MLSRKHTSDRVPAAEKPLKVSLDSNIWEKIFGEEAGAFATVRRAIQAGGIEARICAAGFGIEAIRKRDRSDYFSRPYTDVTFPELVTIDGKVMLKMSFGPDDAKHPGLPQVQHEKLAAAFAAGVKLMYGERWLGLPSPTEIADAALYVLESPEEARAREQRQLDASALIDGRGLGKAAFDAAGGWEAQAQNASEEKILVRACAEWADGELVAAHVAYENDILCTNDLARAAGASVFAPQSRAWLSADLGVRFMTIDELATFLDG